jgi:hypothetical protein
MRSVFLGSTEFNFIKLYQQLLKLLFATDQVVISNTEDNLQKSVYKLNQIIREHGLIYLHRKQN